MLCLDHAFLACNWHQAQYERYDLGLILKSLFLQKWDLIVEANRFPALLHEGNW